MRSFCFSTYNITNIVVERSFLKSKLMIFQKTIIYSALTMCTITYQEVEILAPESVVFITYLEKTLWNYNEMWGSYREATPQRGTGALWAHSSLRGPPEVMYLELGPWRNNGPAMAAGVRDGHPVWGTSRSKGTEIGTCKIQGKKRRLTKLACAEIRLGSWWGSSTWMSSRNREVETVFMSQQGATADSWVGEVTRWN